MPPPKENEPVLSLPEVEPFSGEMAIPPPGPLNPGREGRGGDSEDIEEKIDDIVFAVAVMFALEVLLPTGA